MLQEFSIALFLYNKNKPYEKLLALAIVMHDGLVAMSGVYTTPFPTTSSLATQITSLQNSITGWNNKKGSKAQLETLRTEAKNTRRMLKQLAQYMMDTDPNNPNNWILVGVEVKAAATPVGPLQAAENLRSVFTKTLLNNWLRLRWKKPLGSERAKNVKYKVWRSMSDDFATAELIGIASKTFYQFEPPTTDRAYYWVSAINSDGTDALESDVCFASPKRA